MIVEIRGAGFKNKGAQLMLATVCERLREAFPEVKLCIPVNKAQYDGLMMYDLRCSVPHPAYWKAPYYLLRDIASNLKHIKKPSGLKRTCNLLRDAACDVILLSGFADSLGLLRKGEPDALIDISGYAFGDKWGARGTKGVAKRFRLYKKQNKPVIMLSQMLGPFKEPGQAEAFAKLAGNADLIYAREKESFEHARPLVRDSEKLRMAPDITIPSSPHGLNEEQSPYTCIVPNSKLLEPNPQGQDWKGVYVPRLIRTAHHLQGRGLEVKILQHEYKQGDTKLVDTLAERLNAVEVVRDFDPRVLKGILGGAQIVIGSRFHSLVSTLSMGVPA
ncbi:MAG: polysaccharide pyruvyl transferase family protein, partial [Planctomycetota bacterium]